ncbi:hypothetical protein KY314_02650 [Candidatus Woesearchaeota archaeon]|nr:hypothetical protein [Candidatus Woesearchaeota archaeon]
MKKTIIILTLIILAGCTGIPFLQNKETTILPDIHIGTRGITIDYLEQMPPYEIYENQLFEIGIELHNQGASDIQNAIYNTAVNNQLITLQDEQTKRFNLKGKSMYEPLGAKKRITTQAKTNKLEGQLSRQATTIITNVCYEYATKGTVITCIDTEPLKKQTKVCKPVTQSISQGQGGPLSVVSVEPKIIPHEDSTKIIPAYVIEIQNLGTGQVIDKDMVYLACSGKTIGKENYDIATINAMLSDQLLDCSTHKINLKQKENKILCKLSQGLSKTKGNYQAPLTIELNYGYIQTQPKTITIQKQEY